MSKLFNLNRKSHFLGSKIRALRKRHKLTLEDLVVRCFQINSKAAPSISYLSLIETGHRVPSEKLLMLIADVFQKNITWFLDESIYLDPIKNESKLSSETNKMFMQPNFLFSNEILKTAIPTHLNQTGTSGRQFVQILIRSYQEKHQNQFPNLEKLAENIGKKKLFLTTNDLFKICNHLGLKIKWFNKKTFTTYDDSANEIKTLFRSFFESPNTIYLNKLLKKESRRLKYDLALMIGHKVLHNGDGILSNHATGGFLGGSPQPIENKTGVISQEDILYAWRDFEATFFAGALLCPRIPFRNLLNQVSYNINSCDKLKLTPSVIMRRITSVSPYKDWHYLDAYPPGYLRAVYSGNKISLPWGNMRLVSDPCNQWDIFKLTSNLRLQKPITQLSLMKDDFYYRLFASTAIKTKDAANNSHVLMIGIDLKPAIESQGINAANFINEIKEICFNANKPIIMPDRIKNELQKIGRVLNISWVIDSTNNPVNIICLRSTSCPQVKFCGKMPVTKKISWMNEIKTEILQKKC